MSASSFSDSNLARPTPAGMQSIDASDSELSQAPAQPLPKDPELLQQLAAKTAAKLRESCPGLTAPTVTPHPRVGIVLGSGLHEVAEQITYAEACPYEALPGFGKATADGHRGQFVIGNWKGHPLCAMSGRFHLYEGYSVEQVTFPIRVMFELGIRHLVLSNASGGLNRHFRAGEVMLIDEQVDLTFRCCEVTQPDSAAAGSERAIYSPQWRKRFDELAEAAGVRVARGTYIGLTGPTYETRAEYRFLRDFVGDTVGMSTVWEAKLAAALGMQVLGMSVVTNVASTDLPQGTSSEEVLSVASQSTRRVERWLELILHAVSDLPATKPRG